MKRKHLYLGGVVLGLLAVAAAVSIFAVSRASTGTACTYSISPDALNVSVAAGQTVSANISITSNGAEACAGDTVTGQVWDTPAQMVWPWASIWPQSVGGLGSTPGFTTASFTITFTPPVSVTSSYNPLFRLFRDFDNDRVMDDGEFVGSSIINLTLAPAVCTGMNLTVTPTNITRTSTAGVAESTPLKLDYSCISGNAVPSLTIQVCPPNAPGTLPCELITTLTNVTSGTLNIPTTNYTTSGTYMVRTCMNDSTCATGTNSVIFYVTSSTGGAGQNGTACPTGQVWCPQVYGSTQPAGCYATCPTAAPSTACGIGERCPSGSWCQGGSQCYYPTGELTCVAWPTGTNMGAANYPECPLGTSECSPTDTMCVSLGQIVPYVSGKWCKNGMMYYSTDGKNMTCVKMNSTAPAGFSSCRPDDTNCIPSGGYGPSSGWCSQGMQCYQKTEDNNPQNDRYCAPPNYNTAGGGSDVICPAGYSFCSQGDTNCRQKGDKWTFSDSGAGSIWCSNSKKCSLEGSGGMCVGWNEECPAGAKYCDASQVNSGCLEPNEQKTFMTSGGAYPYCGGGSGGMTLYSYTGTAPSSYTAVCVARPQSAYMDPNWVPTVPAGFRFCRPNDSNCIEPGGTGSSSGWCAWMPPGSGGYNTGSSGYAATTRTCPPLAGYTPPADTTVPPATCTAGQIWCPSSGGGMYCYSGTVCPAVKPVCPAVAAVTSCPTGHIIKTIVNADGCSTSYCEAEAKRATCKEGEGFGPMPATAYAPACTPPYFCWNGTKFEEQDSSYAGSAIAVNRANLCGSFRYEELEWHTLWAKKWDPAKYGIWYWPNYPDPAKSYKLDNAEGKLVSCTQNEYFTPMPMGGYIAEYRSPCQRMAEEDKPLWLARFSAEKKMNDAWQRAERPPTPEPPPVFCPQVIVFAMEPETGKCKAFPTPCDVPKEWRKSPRCDFQPPPPPKECIQLMVLPNCPKGYVQKIVDGCPTRECVPAGEPVESVPPPATDLIMCRRSLRGYYDELRGHRYFFRDVTQQIANAPDRLKETLKDVLAKIEEGKSLAAKTEKRIKDALAKGICDEAFRQAVDSDLNVIRYEIIPAINEQQEALRVAQECQFFSKNIKERAASLRKDAKRFRRQGDKEFAESLLNLAAQFEALLPKAESACTALDSFGLDDVRFELSTLEDDVSDLFMSRDEFSRDRFMDARVEGIRSGMAALRNRISMQGLESKCQQVSEYLDKVEKLLADDELDEAESLRDIVFESAAQCGIAELPITAVEADHRLLFENISGFDEAMVERIVTKVVDKVAASMEVFVNERTRDLLAKAKELEEKALQQLVTAVDNLQKVLKDKQEELQKLLAEKDQLVAKVDETLTFLNQAKKGLSALERDTVRKAVEKTAYVVWCGDLAMEISQKVDLTKRTLEAGELARDDASAFVAFVNEAEGRNPAYCYDEGISKFKDPGMSPEKWFFAHFHSSASPFKGRYDAAGRPTGIVDYARKALWMEGAMVVARSAGVPNVDAKCTVPAAIPGATAVPYGACALDYFVDHDIPLPTHAVSEMMTRGELASLIVALTGDKLPINGGKSYVEDYKDVNYESSHGSAIATVIANKIMLGKSDGVFAPNEVPTRAELAAVIARLTDLFRLTAK